MRVFAAISIVENPDSEAWVIVIPLVLGAFFWISAEQADLTPNPYSLQPPSMRLMWLLLVIWAVATFTPDLWKIARLLEELSCVSVIYFRAVPNPPPKERRQPRGAELAPSSP